jgi:hypothetical protein
MRPGASLFEMLSRIRVPQQQGFPNKTLHERDAQQSVCFISILGGCHAEVATEASAPMKTRAQLARQP